MELACKDQTSGNILHFMHSSSKVVFQTLQQMEEKQKNKKQKTKNHEDSLLEKDPDC